MADNIQLNEGTGGKYAATKDLGSSIHLGKTQLTNSAGAEAGVAAVPLQVSLANHGANATAVLVDLGAADTLGTVTTVGAVTTITNAVAVTNAGITTIAGAVAGTEMQCDVLTMPTVTVNSHAVTNAGTFATQVDGAALTALQLIDNAISGAGFNITQVNGETIDVGAGTEAAAIRVTLPTDGTGVVKLGAGTAEIGKLAAGTAVIGHVIVDTTSTTAVTSGTAANCKVEATIVNASINGAGAPTIDSYQSYTITAKTGADQVIVSSAANKQIWVYGFGFTGSIAGTVAFQDEDNTVHTGPMNIDIKGGMVVAPSGNFAMPIFKLATDKDLELDIVTTTIDGWVCAAIVSV